MSHSTTALLPAKSDPRWAALVTNGTSRPIKLLALKFMLSRIVQDVKRNPSPVAISKSIDELHDFFTKNAKMVERDAVALFG
jgi:hypothetical protein